MAEVIKRRKRIEPILQMSYAERGNRLRQALRRIAELEEERLHDPQYLSLRRELDALRQQFFALQQGAERQARQQSAAVARLERTEAAHRHDADCARAELEAVRTALAETPLSLFRASAETLRALREAAEEQVTEQVGALEDLVEWLDRAGQEMAGELSLLRDRLAEEREWSAHLPRRIANAEARFFASARLARMNGAPPPPENLPQVFYWTHGCVSEKGMSYHLSRAADQHTTL